MMTLSTYSFFNRELSSLVALYIKNGKIAPHDLKEVELSLLQLDKVEKRDNENCSVGLIVGIDGDIVDVQSVLSPNLGNCDNFCDRIFDKELLRASIAQMLQCR